MRQCAIGMLSRSGSDECAMDTLSRSRASGMLSRSRLSSGCDAHRDVRFPRTIAAAHASEGVRHERGAPRTPRRARCQGVKNAAMSRETHRETRRAHAVESLARGASILQYYV